MPEATTLYSVTGVVLAGLVAWVVVVLNKAKEPWSRPGPPEEPADELDTPESKKDDVVGEPTAETKTEEPASTETPKLTADDTARATPVALSEGRQKVASEPAAEEKAGEEKKAEA